MDVNISENWKRVLQEEFSKDYFEKLVEFVKSEYSNKQIYPKGSNIFKAFIECSFEDLKVVILGQDPYHTPGVANGLAFSVNSDQKLPPSLQNIFKELAEDMNQPVSTNGDLTRWAKQGVLLLNSTLTVEKNKPGSHQKKGWESFTDEVIRIVNDSKKNIVFILWGKYAQDKGGFIDESKHLVIKSPHPSPFSANRGFFGSKPFSKANDYLVRNGKKAIEW